MVDITGNKYGKLTVKEMLPKYKQNKSGRWLTYCLCDCDCGSSGVIVAANKLKARHTQSCGCLQKDRSLKSLLERSTTHGMSETKLYAIWCAMRSRCNLKTDKNYKHYGGRGISVCSEWNSNFEPFRDWMIENGYVETNDRNTRYTIDRIDVDGDYTPENCRISTQGTQANNKRNNKYVTYNGETHTIADWARIKGMNYKSFCNRLYKGWSFEEAMTR